MTADLAELLRGVRAAGRVEQLDRGLTRQQRRQLARTVDHRIFDAVAAGATAGQVAEALHVGLSRAQQRISRARRDAPPAPAAPAAPAAPPVEAPDVWLPVPRCMRPAPPPWPVSRRCGNDRGHDGDHDFGSDPRRSPAVTTGSETVASRRLAAAKPFHL